MAMETYFLQLVDFSTAQYDQWLATAAPAYLSSWKFIIRLL